MTATRGVGKTYASEANLILDYQGEALDSHEMDVRDLAPALMSLSNALDIAGGRIAPGAEMTLKATAVKSGSFVVALSVVASYAVSLLTSDPVSAGLNAADIVRLLIDGTKSMRARASHWPAEPDGDAVRIIAPDGTELHVTRDAFELGGDSRFVVEMRNIVDPLSKAGVSSVTISSKACGVPDVEIASGDVACIDSYDPDSEASEEHIGSFDSNMVVQPVSVNYSRGKVWRVTDGSTTYSVYLEDNEFESQVLSGLRIGNHDTLAVTMHSDTWQNRKTGELKTRYSLTRVRYKPYAPPQQGKLNL